MRKIVILLALVTLPALTHSQALKDIQLTFGGGLSVPLSDNNLSKYFNVTTPAYKFSDCWNYGFNLTAGFEYSIMPKLKGTLLVNYSSAPVNKSMVLKQLQLPAGTYVQDGELTTVSGSVGARYILPYTFFENVVPYVGANIGVMNIASDDIYVLIDAYTNYKARFVKSNVMCGSFAVGVDILGGESSAMFVQLGVEAANTKGGSFFYIPFTVGFRGGL